MDARSPSHYRWSVVAMLWCISCFNYADRQAIFSVFPLLEKEFNLSTTQLGLLGSAFAWTYGLAAPLAGFLVDRMTRKTAVLAGLQIWSFICAATAWAKTFPQLLIFRAAEGLGESAYFPASMSLIGDYHGKDTRSRAMGFHQTSVYVGTIAGGFFAGLIGKQYGWRWSFIVFGLLGMLLGIVLWRALREPRRGAADETRASLPMPEALRRVSRTPTFWTLMAAFLCANFVAVVLLTWMPKFVHDQFGLDLALSGLTATLFVQLASLASASLGGWLADRARHRWPGGRMLVQMLGVLGGAPFVLWCGASKSVGALIVALTFWGFFKGLYDANIWASLFDVIPLESRGTAVGAMNLLGWLAGGGTAPVIIGYVASRTSLGYAIGLASAVYVVAGALLFVAFRFLAPRDVIAAPTREALA